MNPHFPWPDINRRVLVAALAVAPTLPQLLTLAAAQAQTSPLASWNDGPAKQVILDFVRATTDRASPSFVRQLTACSIFQQGNSAQAAVGANTDDGARALWPGGKFLYGLT
jgi:hypothetical protein